MSKLSIRRQAVIFAPMKHRLQVVRLMVFVVDKPAAAILL
jgi:hypothetical protein